MELRELCEVPKGRRSLIAKWIYRHKEGIARVEDARWKARLAVHGCNQKDGIEFSEAFYPIVCHTSIIVLLALVALFDLKLEQLDVKTTFPQGELEEEIYMKQPQILIVPRKENLVCHLKKSCIIGNGTGVLILL